jgi:hypothetical protein
VVVLSIVLIGALILGSMKKVIGVSSPDPSVLKVGGGLQGNQEGSLTWCMMLMVMAC